MKKTPNNLNRNRLKDTENRLTAVKMGVALGAG